MKSFFLFIALTFCHFLSADDIANAKTLIYGCHTYICFDNQFYIHSPDCRCDAQWGAITKDNRGNITSSSYYTRKPISNYD